MSLGNFKNLIMLDRERTRFVLVYFILNTLNHLLYADQWYCYCGQMYFKKDGVVSHAKYKAGHCQICKIPHIFPEFERDIYGNMFNMEVLNKYYDQLTKELLKLFEQKPDRIECFQGEFVYGGHEWNSGKYWCVPMAESI